MKGLSRKNKVKYYHQYMIFKFLIMTAVFASLQIINAGIEQTQKYRQLWGERTNGDNLAYNKKVKISRTPNYRRFKKGDTDSKDLTDGKISSRNDGKIWFEGGTVGWFQGASSGINFLIDLEREQPVDSLIIRCLGGKPLKSLQALTLPKSLEVFVSMDGKSFYKTASISKLMPAEAGQSDFTKYYYIPEDGTAFVYPFKLKVASNARFVNIRVTGDTGWFFTDEIAILKASESEIKSHGFNNIYKNESPQELYFSGIIASSRPGKLVVSKNITTPNFLDFKDMRKDKNAKKAISLTLELPPQLQVIHPEAKVSNCLIKGRKYKRWIINITSIRDFILYIKPLESSVEPNKAFIYAECSDEPVHKVELPIELIDIPVVPKLKRLHVSLAWMALNSARTWPDFFKAWSTLGFNAISCFPRYWHGKISKEQQSFINKARKNGFKLVMNESPFFVVVNKKIPAGSEMYSQFSDNRKVQSLCPSYRGKYYEEEMNRIAKGVELVKPDFVFWDIEVWEKGVAESKKCITCQSYFKKSGAKSHNEFLQKCGTEHMKDLYSAVKRGIGNSPMPIVATYNTEPLRPLYQYGLYDFNLMFPKYIDMAQPSLYVAGRAGNIKESIRGNHRLLKNKKIVPWLTAGTYGEFPSYRLEQMILEALLNGATGITYYKFSDFDNPLDFYYHAKALAEIAPYEDLIVDGEVMEPTGSNKQLSYSGIKKNNEILLLIGNYSKSSPETIYKIPFNKVIEVKDLRTGKILSPYNEIKLNVPKNKIRLLYIKGSNQ